MVIFRVVGGGGREGEGCWEIMKERVQPARGDVWVVLELRREGQFSPLPGAQRDRDDRKQTVGGTRAGAVHGGLERSLRLSKARTAVHIGMA